MSRSPQPMKENVQHRALPRNSVGTRGCWGEGVGEMTYMRVVVPVYQAGFRVFDEMAIIRQWSIDGALFEGELHVSHAARKVRMEVSR